MNHSCRVTRFRSRLLRPSVNLHCLFASVTEHPIAWREGPQRSALAIGTAPLRNLDFSSGRAQRHLHQQQGCINLIL